MPPFNPENEKEIILAAKNGDLRAFEQILLSYERRIFNYIYGFVNQKYDAEDLTQETFVKLYRNIAKVDEGKNFKSWLYRIATNTVYDWLRKKKNTPPVVFLDENFSEINEPETIDDANPYENAELGKVLEEALTRIKPAYRAVLTLYYEKDLGYREIAEILNVPVNTIKTHIRRAKAALREILKNQ